MYAYQGSPSWFPQGFQQLPPNVPMMQPSDNGPPVFHTTEIAEASVQNDDVDVEEVPISPVPAPTGKGKRTKVVSRIKLSNFNPEEDLNIVKSCLEIRNGPQTKGRMWDRIMQLYNLRRGSYPERSWRSLQSRWDIIKAEVGKFSSFYADAIQENPSGMSDADKITHAAANFASSLKRHFAYMHCWNIMKDDPKWQDPKPRASAKSGDVLGEDTINLGNDNSVPMMQPSNNGPQVFHPTEIGEASVQNNEVDVEEVPVSPATAPTGKGKRRKVVSRIKLGNFKPEEDLNIVKSCLEIRCAAQTKDRMWHRILQLYNLRRGSYPERSWRSLQSRWDVIKAEVGKFSSFYADAIRENPSGMSDADKTTHAAANFASSLKRHFAYMHCWNIMKDDPRWQDPKPRASAKSAGGDVLGEDTIDLGNDNSIPMMQPSNNGNDNFTPTGSAGKRSMGRDSAKAAEKKGNSSSGSTSSAEYASRMQDPSLQKISIPQPQEESARKNDCFEQLARIDEKRFEEMRSHNLLLLDIEQEKIRIMREKHDMDMQEKERQEDERILGVDLDSCTPAQRIYYEALQEEIFDKIAARRIKRQRP